MDRTLVGQTGRTAGKSRSAIPVLLLGAGTGVGQSDHSGDGRQGMRGKDGGGAAEPIPTVGCRLEDTHCYRWFCSGRIATHSLESTVLCMHLAVAGTIMPRIASIIHAMHAHNTHTHTKR